MILNSNKERLAYWNLAVEKYTAREIEEALQSMQPGTARVLQLHYAMKYPLKDVAKIINRSMTIVRNHQNRGIYKLYKYFEETKKNLTS